MMSRGRTGKEDPRAVVATRRVGGLISSLRCLAGGVSMPTIEMDGVFPLTLDAVWRLLHEHLDEATLREIHPWIRSGRVVRESQPVPFGGQMFPQSKVAEREIRIMGRRFRTTWTYAIEPPLRFAYEIRFENGSTSRFSNAYAAVPQGTFVKTVGEVSMKGVPTFLGIWATRRLLNRADEEDL